MPKRFTALIPGLLSLLSLAILTIAPVGPASAALTTYEFLATSLHPDQVSNFTLRYTDNDGDGCFDLTELIDGSFSGVTAGGQSYPTLGYVPVQSADSPMTDGTSTQWWFQGVPC